MHVVGIHLLPEGAYMVDALQVQELRVGQEVKDEEFWIELPAGTRIFLEDINGDIPPGCKFRLRQNETVKPEDLARLSAMLDQQRINFQKPPEQRVLLDTAIPRPDGNRLIWGLVLGGLGLALCCVVIGFWRHRWLSRRGQLQPGG